MTRCPDESDLLRFADRALSLEETERVRAHVAQCPRCGSRVDALRTLFGDIAEGALPADVVSAIDLPPFDPQEHARAVRERINRLEGSAPGTRRSDRRRDGRRDWRRPTYGLFAWGGGSLAAVAVTVVVAVGMRPHPPSDTWQARGGESASTSANTIRRNVGVQVYAVTPALHPLSAEAVIRPDTPLTAGFRNLGRSPSFLLLFAVDERRRVHWISPAFTRREDDPPSTLLPGAPAEPAAPAERLLATTAVLEDVPAGALRIVAVITATPARVADVEALEGSDVSAAQIERAIPGAEVRETSVRVAVIADVQATPGGHP